MSKSRFRASVLRDLGSGSSFGRPAPATSSRSETSSNAQVRQPELSTVHFGNAQIDDLDAGKITTGTLTSININGGQLFTDTQGDFYPVVVNANGDLTLNSSPNHRSTLTFHDTNVVAADLQMHLAGATGSPNLLVHPDSTASAVFAVLDRNAALGGAYGLYFSANGTATSLGVSTTSTIVDLWRETFIVNLKSGIPVDGDFALPQSGMIVLDTSNSRIYFRVGSTWKYAALT